MFYKTNCLIKLSYNQNKLKLKNMNLNETQKSTFLQNMTRLYSKTNKRSTATNIYKTNIVINQYYIKIK